VKLILFDEEEAGAFNHVPPGDVSQSMKHGWRERERERERESEREGGRGGGMMLKERGRKKDNKETCKRKK